MTADCKSDLVPIPPRIYSRFTDYTLFKYSSPPPANTTCLCMQASTAGSALITALTANKHREEERRRREGQRAARLERSEGNTAKLKGTVTQNIFSLKIGPKGCKDLGNDNDLQN